MTDPFLTLCNGMIYCHTGEDDVGKVKIAVTIDGKIVDRLDRLVHQHAFPNRSQAFEQALQEKLERMDRTRLAREAAKLRIDEERLIAEEGIERDGAEWPAY